jgi:hypothetical protein
MALIVCRLDAHPRDEGPSLPSPNNMTGTTQMRRPCSE